jgi:hypothetical protein
MSSEQNGARGNETGSDEGLPGRNGNSRGGGVVDRRLWPDRRNTRVQGQPPPPPSGLERRRGPGRRLSDFARSAEEGEMTREQFLFLMAIEQFKKANNVTFPTWTDVLEVVRLLGYRKTMPMEIRLTSAEDWREAPDTPSGVRTQRQWERQREAERGFDARRDAA